MKIAIPTNDGINIAENELSAKGFHVYTVEFNEIIAQELRWKNLNTDKGGDSSNLISDCSEILSKNLPEKAPDKSAERKSNPERETIITRIIWHYLEERKREEANTCCCP